MLFNLRHLHATIEIHRLGSITLAAETIHLSQSAVTQGLNKLETTLGFDLFSRSHSGLSATSEGIIFLKRAERAIQFLIDAHLFLKQDYEKTNVLSASNDRAASRGYDGCRKRQLHACR